MNSIDISEHYPGTDLVQADHLIAVCMRKYRKCSIQVCITWSLVTGRARLQKFVLIGARNRYRCNPYTCPNFKDEYKLLKVEYKRSIQFSVAKKLETAKSKQ